MMPLRPSWPSRFSSGCLALLLAVMQCLLVAHAAEHADASHSHDRATIEAACGHDHGESGCSLCRLIAQTSADAPPPPLKLSVNGTRLGLPPLRSPESPRVVEFWICTGPRGPPASA